jgi:hypothetical protein
MTGEEARWAGLGPEDVEPAVPAVPAQEAPRELTMPDKYLEACDHYLDGFYGLAMKYRVPAIDAAEWAKHMRNGYLGLHRLAQSLAAEPQAGAQVPIPDDLKELYELSKRAKLAGREMVYCGLIERIGRLEIALRLVLMKSIDFQNSFCRLCGTKDRHADDCVSHVANTALMEK